MQSMPGITGRLPLTDDDDTPESRRIASAFVRETVTDLLTTSECSLAPSRGQEL